MINKTEKTPEGGQPINSGAEGYYSDSYDLGEEAYGDFDTLEEGGDEGQPEVLDSNSLYREISDLTAMAKSQGAGSEWLKQLEDKKGLVMQSAALSPEKRNEVLAGVRADLETLQSSMNADIEQAPGRDALKKELNDLCSALDSETLDDATKKSVAKKVSDAEQALKKHDLDGAENLYNEAKGDFEDAKTTAEENASQAKNERDTSAKELKQEIKDSDLPQDKKDALAKKVDDLEKSWEGQQPDPDKVKDDLDAIEKDFKREKKVQTLKQSFAGFAAKIPAFADKDLTQTIANTFKSAIDSGDWSGFLAQLHDKSLDQDNLYHCIRQIAGTMFYGMANGDEKVFEQYLDLIPKDVRQAMIDVIMPKFKDNNHWSSNEQDKMKNYLYGATGGALAARLEESMQKDDITGDDAGSSK